MENRHTSETSSSGRVCNKCGNWFEWANFHAHPRGLNQRRSTCVGCSTKASIAWRKANPEAHKKTKNRYYEKTKLCPERVEKRTERNRNAARLKREDPAYLEKIWRQRQNSLESRRQYEKHYQVWTKYGLTADVYRTMHATQNGECAICATPILLYTQGKGSSIACVDHDHVTGAVRGLLCNSCNSAIGYFRDDPALMRRGIDYIRKARMHSVVSAQSDVRG